VTFRQSCIYGYRQFGVEDQGWVAWFTIQTVLGRPITIYGDGKQVRDMLFIDDLLDAYEAAIQGIRTTRGRIYNVGGGCRNTMCLHDLIERLEALSGKKIDKRYQEWRPGDQPVFICDVAKARQDFGWEPRTSPDQGVALLFHWVQENQGLFKDLGL
jgi:CDP-paratose 2-epimerase